RAFEHRRVLRVPENGRLVGPPPRMHGMRRGRLLRQLAEPARHTAPPRHRPSDHPLPRARRELVLVLRGRGGVRGRGLEPRRPGCSRFASLPDSNPSVPRRKRATQMPVINIKFIKDVVATEEQKKELIVKMTDTFVG